MMQQHVSPSAAPSAKRFRSLEKPGTADMRSLLQEDRMTVAVYTSAFPPRLSCGGGCALRYFTITKHLLQDGCKVVIFCPVPRDEILNYYKPFHQYAMEGRLIIITLPSCLNRMYPEIELTKTDFNLMKQIYGHLTAHKPDLFLCPDNVESSVVLSLAKLSGAKKTVYGVHTDLLKMMAKRPDMKAFDIRAILLQVALFAHHIACSMSSDHCAISSEAFRKEIASRFLWKWVRIDAVYESLLWSPHFKLPGSDQLNTVAKWRLELSQGDIKAPLMVYAGRWSLEKRIEMLPPCIPEGWKLAIVGDGPDFDAETTMDLSSDVVFVRRQFLAPEDLAMVYSCADFLVSASDFETFGFVVLEALACGTPVAVENAGGFKETVSDGINGLLLNYEDIQGTKKRLKEYAPGTRSYALMQKEVTEAAKRSGDQSKCYTQRLFERHAPDVWEAKYLGKQKNVSMVQTLLAPVNRFLLWFYVLVAFSLLSLAQAVFV